MKFEFIVGPKGERMVKFDCGECYIIQTDHLGMEYFHIPNIYDTNPNSFKLFAGRIGDAIRAIHEGYGHNMQVNLTGLSFLGGESVIRFVDEEYGERSRQEFIERTQGFKFAYSLKFGSTNSFNMPRYVMCENGVYTVVSWIDELRTSYVMYNSEEAAEAVIAEVEKKADGVVKQYKDYRKNNSDAIPIRDFIGHRLNTVLGRIVMYKFYEGTSREEELDYIFEVAQCITPESLFSNPPPKLRIDYAVRKATFPNVV